MARSTASSAEEAATSITRSTGIMASVTRGALQCAANQFLGRVCTGRDDLQQACRFGRLVAQANESTQGLGFGACVCKARHTKRALKSADAITHLNEQALRG